MKVVEKTLREEIDEQIDKLQKQGKTIGCIEMTNAEFRKLINEVSPCENGTFKPINTATGISILNKTYRGHEIKITDGKHWTDRIVPVSPPIKDVPKWQQELESKKCTDALNFIETFLIDEFSGHISGVKLRESVKEREDFLSTIGPFSFYVGVDPAAKKDETVVVDISPRQCGKTCEALKKVSKKLDESNRVIAKQEREINNVAEELSYMQDKCAGLENVNKHMRARIEKISQTINVLREIKARLSRQPITEYTHENIIVLITQTLEAVKP
ncbi:MAG: hypothetical protein C0602_00050 [Denitrovibrio sp.]|nr:MAG: hypothetical protein C0602_00050 [Denitrovibrio sp.]